MARARILIAEDHVLLAEALCKLLEPQHEVVGIVGDGRALVGEAKRLRPDVVLADISMPLLNGLDAGRQLKASIPSIKIIFLTMNEDPQMAAHALTAGASGYLLKTSASSELLTAIEEALRGRSYLTPRISEKLASGLFFPDPQPDRPARHLTMRQREVLQLLAEGRPMKEVADILQITPRTVAFHKYRTMEAFDLKNNADLIRFAIREVLAKQS